MLSSVTCTCNIHTFFSQCLQFKAKRESRGVESYAISEMSPISNQKSDPTSYRRFREKCVAELTSL